jgi:hypothetical protein
MRRSMGRSDRGNTFFIEFLKNLKKFPYSFLLSSLFYFLGAGRSMDRGVWKVNPIKNVFNSISDV